jgi:hypothetical protein
VYTADLYSLATGAKVSTATQNAGFTEKPGVLDYVMTFHLRDGDLVSHQKKNFAPDPDHSGHLLTGIHPQGKTIVPDKGAGAYAGRTGQVRMSGWLDGNKFPEQVKFNDFYFIELDPKS